MSVVKVIYNQIGGNRFKTMTGARNFVNHGNALSFRIPRTNSINYIKITLDADDTYSMEFGRIHGNNYTVVKELSGIYCDQLEEIIADTTGLATRL